MNGAFRGAVALDLTVTRAPQASPPAGWGVACAAATGCALLPCAVGALLLLPVGGNGHAAKGSCSSGLRLRRYERSSIIASSYQKVLFIQYL